LEPRDGLAFSLTVSIAPFEFDWPPLSANKSSAVGTVKFIRRTVQANDYNGKSRDFGNGAH
jgi:hypothetical protein